MHFAAGSRLKQKPAEEVISIIPVSSKVSLITEIKRLGVKMHLFILAALMASAMAGPTLYNIDKEAGTAERVMKDIMQFPILDFPTFQVMVPVSSTVIPLEELPETQVGFGFGVAKGHPIKKPAYLKVRLNSKPYSGKKKLQKYGTFGINLKDRFCK